MWFITKRATLAPAFEDLVLTCFEQGREIMTEYGELSKDLSPGGAVISFPLKQPMVHRGAVGWHKRESYVKEVLEGSADWRIGKDWWYTYHQRLFNWPYTNFQIRSECPETLLLPDISIDQVDYIAQKLSAVPYSRRAQATTWQPVIDTGVNAPPCLQRVWCRVVGEGNSSLEMQTSWRSRDLWNAWWLNVYAMFRLQELICKLINDDGADPKVFPGRYTDISSSLHIYQRNWDVVKNFVEVVMKRPALERYRWDVS